MSNCLYLFSYNKKFKQHQDLKDKLIKLVGNIYEASKHPVFGADFSLAKKDMICKQNIQGGNKLGLALEDIRSKVIAKVTQPK